MTSSTASERVSTRRSGSTGATTNELKYPLESCVEFKVLGRWRNNLDDSGEADTYYVTVGDMLENGHDKDDVKAAIKAFYEASLEAALTAVDEYEPGQLDDEQ